MRHLALPCCLLAGACLNDLQFVRGAGAFCELDMPCVADHYCDLEVLQCTPKKELAAQCPGPEACRSGFCADGVCCESACDDLCSTCDVPGDEGSCVAAAPGTDPREDCPGTTQCAESGACQASPLWSAPFGEGKDQTAAALALGADGSIAIAGGFRGTLVFDKPLQNITPDRQAFVAAFDGDGSVAWSLQCSDGVHEATAVAVDDGGAVYLVGNFEGTRMDVDPATPLLAGAGKNLFAVKLVGGSVDWAVAFGGASDQQALGAAVQDGLLAIVGTAAGTTTFGLCGDHGSGTDSGMLLLVLDATSGACTAASVAAGTHTAAAVVPIEGDFVVAGFGQGPITIADASLTAGGDDDIILARVDPTLTTARWANTFPGTGADRLAALAAADGVLWAAGSLEGTLTLPSQRVTSIDDRDALVLRLDAETGDPIDAATFGGPYDQEALAIAVGPGVAAIGGRFEVALDDVSGRGGFDAFVARLDDLTLAWSLPLGGRMQDATRGVAVDAEGDLAVIGDFQDIITLGADEIVSKGDSDIFLAKLRP